MNTPTEFPTPVQPVGFTFDLAALRAHPLRLHNSRLACWFTMGLGIIALPMGGCMVIMALTQLFPASAVNFAAVVDAAQWGIGGLFFCAMCPALWKWGARMLNFNIQLDARGVDFNLGTKKKPVELFMSWDDVSAVQQKRTGNSWEFTVHSKTGSWATFNSYTFFRSKHAARAIAQRAGVAIQKI